jgi:hypothetical protein
MTRFGRLFKRALVATAVFLVVAQAFRIERGNPPVESDIGAPPAVQALLRRACYDCHSYETVWPWYAHVAPISWLLAHDVSEGRDGLNFSAWTRYDPAKRAKKLREVAEEVAEGEMPLWYYVLVHPEARLDDGEREQLRAWAVGSARAARGG